MGTRRLREQQEDGRGWNKAKTIDFDELWQWHQKFNGQIYKLFYGISTSQMWLLAWLLFMFMLHAIMLAFCIHGTYWNGVRALIVLKIWCGLHWPFEWILVYIVYYSWYFMCDFLVFTFTALLRTTVGFFLVSCSLTLCTPRSHTQLLFVSFLCISLPQKQQNMEEKCDANGSEIEIEGGKRRESGNTDTH